MSGLRVLHVDTSTEWRGGQQQLVYLLEGRPGDAWAGVPDGALAARLGPPTVPLRPGADAVHMLTHRSNQGRGSPRGVRASGWGDRPASCRDHRRSRDAR